MKFICSRRIYPQLKRLKIKGKDYFYHSPRHCERSEAISFWILYFGHLDLFRISCFGFDRFLLTITAPNPSSKSSQNQGARLFL
jgi:hypothetical protein